MGGRGDAVHAYLPFFGSALAPIFGAFVTQDGNWRWIFWGTSIFSAIAVALAFFCLDETNHRVLLERKARLLREETGNKRLHTPFHNPDQTHREWMMKKIALPFIMLVCHPVVQVPFGYRAYLFGVMYLMLVVPSPNPALRIEC
jgi:MFS family permease